jgi:hypothetical protein
MIADLLSHCTVFLARYCCISMCPSSPQTHRSKLAFVEVVFEQKLVQVVVNHALTRSLESLFWPDVGRRSEKLAINRCHCC